MPTLEELLKISEQAEHLNVSDEVRYIAERVAKSFSIGCVAAAQKGKRFYSAYAAEYNHKYIFVDRSAVKGEKNITVEWGGFYAGGEEKSVDIIDDFIMAVKAFIEKEGILKYDIRKVSVDPPRSVGVCIRSFGGLHYHREHVPVPCWYIQISTEW